MKQGKKLYIFIVKVLLDTELFQLIEVYLENGLEMALFHGTGEDFAHLLFKSSGK